MKNKLKNQIRRLLLLFIACLCISGITASFIETELAWINDYFSFEGVMGEWLSHGLVGIQQTNEQYPFIAYSADWLAFSHLALALFFIGPLLNPVENRWVLIYGMVICVAVFPVAFIAGYFRGIPLFWQLIDCCFGLFGGALLWVILRKVDRLVLGLETGSRGLEVGSQGLEDRSRKREVRSRKMGVGRRKFDLPRLTPDI